MVYLLRVAPSNSKTNRVPHVIHDLADIRSKCRAGHIEQDGLVAASDIESDATRTNRVFVRDHSADWDGIAFVMVGHQCDLVSCLGTCLDLTERTLVRRTPHWDVVDELHFISPF